MTFLLWQGDALLAKLQARQFSPQCNFAVKTKYNGTECLQEFEAVENGPTSGLKCSLVSKT